MENSSFDISVIIPTFNRLTVLRETLRRMSEQTFPREKFEVLVIDDCSSDGTADFLASYRMPVSFRYFLNKENLGRAKSRNIGIKQSKGKLILMVDDDVWASPVLLEKHMSQHALHTNEIAAVGAILVAPEVPRSTINEFLTKHHVWCYAEMNKYGGPLPYGFCKTASLSVTKNLLQRIGMFNEAFTLYGGEDTELGYRLGQAGIELYFAREAVGYHYHDETLEGYIKKEIDSGMSLETYRALVPERDSRTEGFFTPFYHSDLRVRSILYNIVKLLLFLRPVRWLNMKLVCKLKGSERFRPMMIRYLLPLLKIQSFRHGLKRIK